MGIVTTTTFTSDTETVTRVKLNGLVANLLTEFNGNIDNNNIKSSAAIAYSKLNLTGAILNADLAGSITYAKLVLTGSIVNADISASAAIAYSKITLTGSVVNADINASAAIVASKLDLTSPGAIGTTAPAAGKHTTLEATSTFKLGTTNQGDILYDNGTSLVRLTPGTSGQYLKTQGASANPTWATITTPALVLLSTTTVSAAANSGAITLTAGKAYRIIFKLKPVASGNNLTVNINSDSSTAYWLTGTSSAGQTKWSFAPSVNPGGSMSVDGYIDLSPRQGSANHCNLIGQALYVSSVSGNLTLAPAAQCVYQGGSATSITFSIDGGDVMSGTVWVYEYSGT